MRHILWRLQEGEVSDILVSDILWNQKMIVKWKIRNMCKIFLVLGSSLWEHLYNFYCFSRFLLNNEENSKHFKNFPSFLDYIRNWLFLRFSKSWQKLLRYLWHQPRDLCLATTLVTSLIPLKIFLYALLPDSKLFSINWSTNF